MSLQPFSVGPAVPTPHRMVITQNACSPTGLRRSGDPRGTSTLSQEGVHEHQLLSLLFRGRENKGLQGWDSQSCTVSLLFFFFSYPKFPLPNNHHPASMTEYLMSLFLANYVCEVFKWSHVLPLGVSLLTD